MGRTLHALCRGEFLGVAVGLDVSAGGVVGIQILLDVLAQLHGDFHRDAAARGDLHRHIPGKVHGKVGVIGRDLAVAIQIIGRQLGFVQLTLAGGIVQDGLNIRVRVVAAGLHQSVVHLVRDLGGELDGQGVQIDRPGIGKQILGKDIGIEEIVRRLILQIGEGVSESILAGLAGIVAQLHLHLAVRRAGGGVSRHREIAVRLDGAVDVGKARALLQHGIVRSAVPIHHRLSGGHQQALGQMTGGNAGLLRKPILPEVLGQHGHHAGDLGSCHGGTGHILICLAAFHSAVDGVDVAAGGGDLGLQLQGAGHAPGAEGAHGIVLTVA